MVGELGLTGVFLPEGKNRWQPTKQIFEHSIKDAHAVECLSEREKMLMGLAVAMMRLCDP